VSETPEEAPARPLLRVVKGDPTPEELAALVAVLASRGGGEPAPEPPRSPWGRPGVGLRQSVPIGPSAWRESGSNPGLRTRADW
jgi:Acyl-CoA carboxylase epsilon subunit